MKPGLLLSLTAAAVISLVGCDRNSDTQRTAQAKQESPTTKAAQAQPAAPQFKPVASVEELMAAVVMPSADALWKSVATISNETGVHVRQPKTDADWEALRLQALVLAESANLLMIKGRNATAKDEPDEPGALGSAAVKQLIDTNWSSFVAHAERLHTVTMTLLQDIQAKDAEGILRDGGTLDEACEACHSVFWYPPEKK